MKMLITLIISFIIAVVSLFTGSFKTDMPDITEKSTEPATVSADSDDMELKGYWQSDNYDYLEITEDAVILRDNFKRIILQEGYNISETDGLPHIEPDDPDLSYDGYPDPYGTVSDMYYEDGCIHMIYYHFYSPDDIREIIYKPVDESPFADIIIRDDEFLDEMQGLWQENPDSGYNILIEGNHMTIGYYYEESFEALYETDFHVISYRGFPEYVYLIGSDLVETDFYAFTQFKYSDGKLRTNEMVLDAEWDTSIEFELAP